jgi:O-succinylbenzoic acid--CoA ligase
LTENSRNLTNFNVSYSSDYTETPFVKGVIDSWNKGADEFTLKTSGSTGIPKEIKLSRETLIWSAEQTFSSLALKNYKGQHTALCCLPVRKAGGFMQLIRALHFNWHIHFINPSSNPIEQLQLKASKSAFNISSFTPTQIQKILATDEAYLSSQLAILIGGAPISFTLEHELIALVQATKTDIWETYGMTETASHIALRKIGIDHYFKPQPGVEVSLSDEQLCISIPELHFFIKTNDIAKLHADGFEILGRSDDVINSGGIKIHPALIEPKIKTILHRLGIDSVFYITKMKDHERGEKAVLVLAQKPLKDKNHLLKILKRELPDYHNPKEIFFVDHIVYTDTGKVKRMALE